MRHLGSLLLSLLVTAMWVVVLGLGMSRFAGKGGYDAPTGWKLFFVAMLLLAAGLYALLLLTRLSPLGPVLVGLALVGVGLWDLLVTGPNAAFRVLPTDLFGEHFALQLPVHSGLTTFAAVPMILTIFSPRRWRRYADRLTGPTPYSATPPVPVPLAPVSGGYPPPADPFARPVSPAGTGPEGTHVLPGPGSVSSPPLSPAAPSYPPPSSYPAPSYPAPSSGAPSYPAPSSGAPSYSAPSYSAPSYSAPSYSYPAPTPPPTGPAPVWPSAPNPTPDDPEATRPL
jgi:hypothetical protein